MDNAQKIWEDVYKGDDLPWTQNPIPTEILKKFISHLGKGDIVLDCGGGDGLLSQLLIDEGFDVVCSDISERALNLAKEKFPNLKTVQASSPAFFAGQEKNFDGVLVWGVMHHVPKDDWKDYLKDFYTILQKEGVLLIGGHSRRDEEFASGFRISPTTGKESFAADFLQGPVKEAGFHISEEGFFEFQEAFTGNERVFKWFLLQK